MTPKPEVGILQGMGGFVSPMESYKMVKEKLKKYTRGLRYLG